MQRHNHQAVAAIHDNLLQSLVRQLQLLQALTALNMQHAQPRHATLAGRDPAAALLPGRMRPLVSSITVTVAAVAATTAAAPVATPHASLRAWVQTVPAGPVQLLLLAGEEPTPGHRRGRH
jgi:hypothetical protein